MRNKTKWLISKKDLEFNLKSFTHENNILFITGLVGSGKSTLARELGKKYSGIVIIQDFLSWSDCYNSDECLFFVDLFQRKYPETKEYFKNNVWRSDLFCKSDIHLFMNKPLIIKRTSAIKSFIRNFKRGNKDNKTFKKKFDYLKRMKWEFKKFYVEDLPKLNHFIINIIKKVN